VTLVLLGLTVVYSATFYRGTGFLKSQLLRAAIGTGALLVGVRLRHTLLRLRVSWLLLGASVAMLVATLALGLSAGAARRWLGSETLSVQPAELAKLTLLIWLAGWFAHLKEDRDRSRQSVEHSFRRSLLVPGAVSAVVIGLTLAQPAIGTSFIMAASALAIFFVAGVRVRYMLLTLLVSAALLFAATTTISYPRRRWQSFIHGDRYHQEQSLIAIGSGGLLGKGLGEGKQKFLFLPKVHNDFIFAEVGEEFGFAGCAIVFALYALLFLRGVRISRECSGYFGQNLAAGVTTMLFLYAIVHVAVVVGVIPVTGQPLPFVSFGGSALVTNLLSAGILLNISRYRSSHVQQVEPWRTAAAFPGSTAPRPRLGALPNASATPRRRTDAPWVSGSAPVRVAGQVRR
jgi:cell division protein FtsW